MLKPINFVSCIFSETTFDRKTVKLLHDLCKQTQLLSFFLLSYEIQICKNHTKC